MINTVIRLIEPGMFGTFFENLSLDDDKGILVKPILLSICAADMRYFLGKRSKEVLEKKLPLALFHEAVGKVVFSNNRKFQKDSFCVMLPCYYFDEFKNYSSSSLFRSSNIDGFSQEFLMLHEENLIPIPQNYDIESYVFSELMSVSCQAISRLSLIKRYSDIQIVGIWGDGVMGYITALTFRSLYPQIKLVVFGKHDDKLNMFSFADIKYNIADESCLHVSLDVAFDCVGGEGSGEAICTAISLLKPCGTLVLMGVSENNQSICTRKILEKGIILLGSSRSERKDFDLAVNLISKMKNRSNLNKMIGWKKVVRNALDLREAFQTNLKAGSKGLIELDL